VPASRRAAPRDASVDADVGQLAGKPLYLALCAPCHGAEGKGYAADHAPSLVSSTFLESASEDFLRRGIVAGRPGTSMAAYGKASGGPLDDAAVDRLVEFLRAQAPPARALPPVVAGDAATGAAIYAKQCFSCHGDARTRGEAVSLANPQLLAAASDSFLRYAIAAGRPGTKMEAFAGKLSDAELDSVVRYLRTLGNGGPARQQLLPEPTGKEPIVLNPKGKMPKFKLRAAPCPPPQPGAKACKPDPRFVSVEQVGKAVVAGQRMVIVDARPPSDWRRSHIAGAVSIPYHELKRLDELPRDGTWIIAYCACPHHLSGIVVDALRKRGFANAVVLDEGVNEWHRRGLPMTTADGVTRPLPEPTPGGATR
jgi:mono/diheme cytochrome c family protein/rhodanese-related sulfurtransferase